MKSTPLFLALVLSLTLAACGKDKPEETAAVAPAATAETVAPPMPMDPGQGVAGHVDAVADGAAGESGHDLYAAKCISCHGASGEGLAGNPKLAGLSRADIQSRLADYRDGKKLGPKTPIMAAMAKTLTDAQIAALAGYLGE